MDHHDSDEAAPGADGSSATRFGGDPPASAADPDFGTPLTSDPFAFDTDSVFPDQPAAVDVTGGLGATADVGTITMDPALATADASVGHDGFYQAPDAGVVARRTDALDESFGAGNAYGGHGTIAAGPQSGTVIDHGFGHDHGHDHQDGGDVLRLAAEGGDGGATPMEAGPTDTFPTSTYALDGQNYIDSLSYSLKWGGGLGAGVTLTYSFGTASSVYESGYSEPTNGFGEFTEAQKAATRTALDYYADIADLTFVEVTDSATVAGDLRFARSSDPSTAWAYLPTSGTAKGGDVWIGNSSNYDDMSEGTYGFQTLLHEIGHALGMTHPHDGGVTATSANDWLGVTLMSYKSYEGAPNGYRQDFYPTSPMYNDIAAMQYIYGANDGYNATDTVYSWTAGAQLYETIWDGGGTDTIDWSNQTSAATINLNAGQWSELGPEFAIDYTVWPNVMESRTLMIAENVVIENATGGSGNDTLTGNGVANVLDGGAGDDTLVGGAGSDTFLFGLGFGNDAISDFAAGDGSDDIIDVSAFGITSYSTLLSNIADVGGNAVLTLSGNTLTLTGVTKSQLSSDDFFDVVVGPTTGDDTLDGTTGDDTLRGWAGNDTMSGGAGNDTLYGGAGDDVMIGGAGSDAMHGGAGSDTASYADSSAGVTIGVDGAAGTGGDAAGDTLFAMENITGSAFNDRLKGNADVNTLSGGDGDDVMLAGPGADVVNGGLGTDIVAAGSGNDTVDGGAGADFLEGQAGDDTLTGGTGDDTFLYLGSFGADTITDFTAGAGSEDAIDLSAYGIGTFTTLLASIADSGADTVITVGGSGTITLTGVLKAELHRDDFIGLDDEQSAGDDTLVGTAGNDSLDGLAGNDTLLGGDGDDTLVGGAGADVLNGGNGTDTADYSASAAGVTVDLSGAAGSGGDAAGDTLFAVENVTGSAAADTFYGSSGNNVLDGGAGNDRILAGPGADTVTGGTGDDVVAAGSGNDVIDGGVGADRIEGQAGDDTLTGGDGADTLTGGGGIDSFAYTAMSEQGDTIVDFTAGTGGDVMDVSALLTNLGYGGADPFGDGWVQSTQSGADTLVQIDADGGGDAYVTLATLLGVTETNLNTDNWTV